jgi:exopolysaccharide biosynthesis polyprenyl glycosylphosphotransferase
VFSRHHRRARVLFGLSDVLLTALAFEAAYQTRFHLDLRYEFYLLVPEKALLLGFTVLFYLALGAWLKVYDRLDSGSPRVIVADALRQCLLGAAGVALFQYSFRLDLSRFFVGLLAVYSAALFSLFRLSSGKLAGLVWREFGAHHYVLMVGLDERARRVGRALEDAGRYGVRLVGFLAARPGDPGQSEIRLNEAYPVHRLEELPGLLERRVIDEVLFAVASDQLAELEDVFLLCDEEGVRTRIAVDFFPHINSTVYLERLGSVPLLTFSATPYDEIRLLLKRVIDVVCAAVGLALLAAPMLVVALLVKLTSPGPAIFRQVRCGLNGRRFVLYKFRSMCANAEELRPALEHLSHRETAFKLRDDPRLTPIGRWLRKFSIDEWPQLWNVLKGDMSLVGPRPAVPQEVEKYQRWQRRRLRMRPGLTCLWTLAGRDHVDFETWMKLDMQYIDTWSLTLDWSILLRTCPGSSPERERTRAMHLVPTEVEVKTLLEQTGGLRRGHFEYPNGLHASEYLQVPLAMRYYQHAKTLSVGLSRLVRANPEIRALIPELSIVTLATGGLPVAYGMCEALRAHQVYWAERESETAPLRFRQFLEQVPGEKCCRVDYILQPAGS